MKTDCQRKLFLRTTSIDRKRVLGKGGRSKCGGVGCDIGWYENDDTNMQNNILETGAIGV